MYQALYRKWRPRTFSEMTGQAAVIRTLRNQVASGRVAHAYLFCGSRGTGKTSAAKIMARAINCENNINGDPCLECPSCLALGGETSLDVFEMDAASNSRVEEIRDLLEKVDYPPQFSRYKVYIIDEVHMLSNAAFNALLKTLEEPPSYMVFILAPTAPQKIPPTILSRCQRFDFGRLTEEDMTSRMLTAMPELNEAEPAALSLIARAADGAMRDAWSLLDMCLGSGEKLTESVVRQALGAADSEFLFDFAAALAVSDSRRALDMIDELMRGGRDVQVYLRDFSAHVRQLTAFKLGAANADMTRENAGRYQEQAKEISMPRLIRMLELAMQAETDTRYASSPRSVLELFALKSCRVAEENDPQALMDRVEELEHQLSLIRSRGIALPQEAAPAPKPEKKPAAPRKAETAIPTPDSALVNGKKPSEIWNAMLGRLQKEEVALFSIVNTGKFGGYKDGTYKLLFDSKAAISRDFVSHPDRHSVIEKMLTEEGGTEAHFVAETEGQHKVPTHDKQDRDEQTLIETFGRDKIQIDE